MYIVNTIKYEVSGSIPDMGPFYTFYFLNWLKSMGDFGRR